MKNVASEEELINEDLRYYFPFAENKDQLDQRSELVNEFIKLILLKFDYNYNKALQAWNSKYKAIIESNTRNYYELTNSEVPFDALSEILTKTDADVVYEWSANFKTQKQVVDYIVEACKLYYGDKIIFEH